MINVTNAHNDRQRRYSQVQQSYSGTKVTSRSVFRRLALRAKAYPQCSTVDDQLGRTHGLDAGGQVGTANRTGQAVVDASKGLKPQQPAAPQMTEQRTCKRQRKGGRWRLEMLGMKSVAGTAIYYGHPMAMTDHEWLLRSRHKRNRYLLDASLCL